MIALRTILTMLLLIVVACGGVGAPARQAEMSGGYPAADSAATPAAPGVARAEEYAPSDDAVAFAGEASPPAPPLPPAAPGVVQPPVNKPDVPPTSEKPAGIKPLLIYTATYHMAVFETDKAIDAVQSLAKELDGYLVRRDDTSIIIRVPSESYRGALDRIGKIGDVLHRQETVEDVTEQFMDLMTRLKNARAVRDRLQQLLHQAKDVKDALEVERELARLTGEIEVMEGKLKRLRELVAFSTITLRFEPMPTEQIRSNVRLPFPWLDRIGLSNLLDL